MDFYFVKPIQSKKWHIHNGDGRTLCGKWLMTSKREKVPKDFEPNQHDCKACVKKYNSLKGV